MGGLPAAVRYDTIILIIACCRAAVAAKVYGFPLPKMEDSCRKLFRWWWIPFNRSIFRNIFTLPKTFFGHRLAKTA